jgi:hypothetical protein
MCEYDAGNGIADDVLGAFDHGGLEDKDEEGGGEGLYCKLRNNREAAEFRL